MEWRSDAGAVLVCCAEETAERESKAFDCNSKILKMWYYRKQMDQGCNSS